MSKENLEKIIAIDMDGTICTINDKYQDCELLEGARESINYIKKDIKYIYILVDIYSMLKLQLNG